MNITYLFGAGASYNSIPIVGEMEKAFKAVLNWNDKIVLLNTNLEKNFDELGVAKKVFESILRTAEYNTSHYGTIDTYAKKLFINGDDGDLENLKAALILFFALWQESKLQGVDLTPVREKEKGEFKDIDGRYLGLLTNYLKRENEGGEIYDNVKFLSWNYDTQLERGLAFIFDKEVTDIISKYKIYPFRDDAEPSIVHLNGVAGLYKSSSTGPWESGSNLVTLFREKNPIGSEDPTVVLRKLLFFINSVINKSVNVGECFTFAWERDKSNKAIEHAKKILNNTDALVIIGYSFPNFNNEIDQELFSALKNNGHDYKIYYQDPNANKTLIAKRFGIEESRIEIDNVNLNQFLLPLERI